MITHSIRNVSALTALILLSVVTPKLLAVQTFKQVAPFPETNHHRATRTVTQAEWGSDLFAGITRQVAYTESFTFPQGFTFEKSYQFALDPFWHRIVNGMYDSQDKDESYLLAAGEHGSGAWEFRYPIALDVDWDHHVYVADYGNKRIAVLEFGNNFISWVGVKNLNFRPIDVAWRQKGSPGGDEFVYVLGSDAKIRKYEFIPDNGGSGSQWLYDYGTFDTIPGAGKFRDPVGLCVGQKATGS